MDNPVLSSIVILRLWVTELRLYCDNQYLDRQQQMHHCYKVLNYVQHMNGHILTLLLILEKILHQIHDKYLSNNMKNKVKLYLQVQNWIFHKIHDKNWMVNCLSFQFYNFLKLTVDILRNNHQIWKAYFYKRRNKTNRINRFSIQIQFQYFQNIHLNDIILSEVPLWPEKETKGNRYLHDW